MIRPPAVTKTRQQRVKTGTVQEENNLVTDPAFIRLCRGSTHALYNTGINPAIRPAVTKTMQQRVKTDTVQQKNNLVTDQAVIKVAGKHRHCKIDK